MLGIDQGKGLNTNTKQEAHKDRRFYAAIPYRAFKDRRLGKNEYAVLVAACGFLDKGAQVAQIPQTWIAEQMGVHYTLVLRHIKRLEAFGYLVRLAPRNKDAGQSTLYGIVFDPDNKPTRESAATVQHIEEPIEQLLKKEATVQRVVTYPPSRLIGEWRKVVVDYQANELELKHWQELSILGATPEFVAALHQPGRDLIGYYMQQARSTLKQAG